MAFIAAVLVVPSEQPSLWACYPPGGGSDTNAVFNALSRTTSLGREHLPGIDGISRRMEGVRVDIDPYAGGRDVDQIRRLMAAAPGVPEVRRGAPCPG